MWINKLYSFIHQQTFIEFLGYSIDSMLWTGHIKCVSEDPTFKEFMVQWGREVNKQKITRQWNNCCVRCKQWPVNVNTDTTQEYFQIKTERTGKTKGPIIPTH